MPKEKVVEIPVTMRNFNRVKFGTKSVVRALLDSGWKPVEGGLLQRNSLTLPHPPPFADQPVLEWAWQGVNYRLCPDTSGAVVLPTV